MITWQETYVKTQRLSKDNNPDTLIQLKQDLNTGYKLFNAKVSRYFTRKQQFTDLIEGQQQYQTPIDSIRVMGITCMVSSSFQPTVKEIRSEYQWRQITSVPSGSNWPTYYYVLGDDQIALWPVPSQDVAAGLRYYYQPQDHDLSLDDVTSSTVTVSVTNGSSLVTASGSIFTGNMIGCWFQLTGVNDLSWYQIVGQTATTLTLKSAFVGPTASAQPWRVGQCMIIPQEFSDAPMHYSLGNYFSSQGNENRAQYHLGTIDKPGVFYQMIKDCEQEYSSSNQSHVITQDENYVNPWFLPPTPGPIF